MPDKFMVFHGKLIYCIIGFGRSSWGGLSIFQVNALRLASTLFNDDNELLNDMRAALLPDTTVDELVVIIKKMGDNPKNIPIELIPKLIHVRKLVESACGIKPNYGIFNGHRPTEEQIREMDAEHDSWKNIGSHDYKERVAAESRRRASNGRS